jgi:hypothetical protein
VELTCATLVNRIPMLIDAPSIDKLLKKVENNC